MSSLSARRVNALEIPPLRTRVKTSALLRIHHKTSTPTLICVALPCALIPPPPLSPPSHLHTHFCRLHTHTGNLGLDHLCGSGVLLPPRLPLHTGRRASGQFVRFLILSPLPSSSPSPSCCRSLYSFTDILSRCAFCLYVSMLAFRCV